MSSDEGGVGTISSSATVRRGRSRDGAFRGVVFEPVELDARRAVEVVREPDCGGAFFLADTVLAAVFFAPLRAVLRAALRAVVLRPPCRDAADFRVDLPAERAPPRAVLRADDFDRLLDDALRLAMVADPRLLTLTVSDKFRRL
jgi:hypothetical protein